MVDHDAVAQQSHAEAPEDATTLRNGVIAATAEMYSTDDPAATTIWSYMLGELSAHDVVQTLADPVDQAYTSADFGWRLWEMQQIARQQREAWSAEEWDRIWGPLGDGVPQPEGKREDRLSAEGELWELWGGVLLAGRRTSWRDEAGQNRLVDLCKAFKARPDPPLPAKATKALRNNWIWKSGRLWSELSMLGPSAREHWNDAPRESGGFSVAEVESWLNVNAFAARLSVAEVFDFSNYGIWALREALEEEPGGSNHASKSEKLGVSIREAAVWVSIAGRLMWEKVVRDDDGEPPVTVDAATLPSDLPWSVKSRGQDTRDYTPSRWRFWKARFRVLSERETLSDQAKLAAKDAAELMSEIEREKPLSGHS
ncbi:hypothetical protein BAUCODRAFT_282212 [Baudoinia panamericana UAMH 10762]|uniref:Nuclear pore complex protein n=1 Tax=Baudoinia panamericana (strain UAMH 10762) TaxID=717646 RepID=M2MLF1_BAUPA|nr:uncharacterized protein BAUCODRAFT_282212 [Baudoinia panamericana UAMH 10762]EMC92218.1 hypothetical protein BAUCODRAFT_282212 [Baudoinia panamericana UAMH 10762]